MYIIITNYVSKLVTVLIVTSKQLLGEVEHDIMNYQNRGLCYLPKAEADNTDTKRSAILFLRRTLQGA